MAAPVFSKSWKLVWSDEFNYTGLPDSTKWTNEVGMVRNKEAQYYTQKRIENNRVENGNLLLIARKEPYKGAEYTSASLKTKGKYQCMYGKIVARMKLPRQQSLWPAFWMIGTDTSNPQWPFCGEIDIMEQISRENKVYGTIHWAANGKHAQYGTKVDCDVEKFHDYAIEWDEKGIRWFVDDKQYFESKNDSIKTTDGAFNHPYFLIVNLAIGGGWPGYPDETTCLPDTAAIDYIRVYQKK